MGDLPGLLISGAGYGKPTLGVDDNGGTRLLILCLVLSLDVGGELPHLLAQDLVDDRDEQPP